MVTQEELHRLFDYREDGNLIWKNHRWSNKNGKISGSYETTINGKTYKTKRLIYIYHFGRIKDNISIYHRNLNKQDNRIENLYIVENYICDITQQFLQETFYYSDGKLYWKQLLQSVNRVKVGDLAGFYINGYRSISINNKQYRTNRLVWM